MPHIGKTIVPEAKICYISVYMCKLFQSTRLIDDITPQHESITFK